MSHKKELFFFCCLRCHHNMTIANIWTSQDRNRTNKTIFKRILLGFDCGGSSGGSVVDADDAFAFH